MTKKVVIFIKLIYIASPYAGDIAGNTERAREYCLAAVREGYNVYCPHLLLPQFMNDTDPAERRLAMKMGREMIEKCDAVWVCGPVISAGMQSEIDCAERIGITVVHRPDILENNFERIEKFCISTQAI